jgi:NAD(P)H-flavin reductase
MGTFPYDAVHLHQFYPINHNGVSTAGLPDYDNWTISTQMLVSYPALFIFGVLPLFRNQGWELFKFTHFFFLVLIPSTLVHAESSWYFLIGGIAFYLIDAGVRFVSVTSPTSVLLSAKTYEAEGGVVELQISKAHPYPGQFAWVNVPAVSTWEWHPFSLASSPYDGVSKMCIKNMGKGSFTDKLYQLVHEGDASALTVQLDGAYGPPFDPADHAAFLLIAGGIGVTQPHSTLRTLSQMAMRQELPASLKMVHMIWIGRSPELFRILDDTIAQCLQAEYPTGSPKFSVTLYATVDEQSEATFSAPLKKGRPSFPQIYSEAEVDLAAVQSSAGPSGTIFVQACGPASMVSAAEEAAAGNERIIFDSALFRL